MRSLKAEPALFDLPGWRARLEVLRKERAGDDQDILIHHAERHIAALEANLQETAAERA